MFKTIYQSVLPKISNNKHYADNLQIVLRPQIQPWHPSSTLTHESAVAILLLSPESFWQYSNALFENQKEYFDVNVVNETRNATYKRLAKLAKESVGADEAEVYKLLEIPDKPAEDGSLNVGNGVTNDLKRTVRANRVIGVHVTPTVFLNGIEDGSISSGWTADQWLEWLEKNVK